MPSLTPRSFHSAARTVDRCGALATAKMMLKMQVDPDELLKTKGKRKSEKIGLDECLKTKGLLEIRGESGILLKRKAVIEAAEKVPAMPLVALASCRPLLKSKGLPAGSRRYSSPPQRVSVACIASTSARQRRIPKWRLGSRLALLALTDAACLMEAGQAQASCTRCGLRKPDLELRARVVTHNYSSTTSFPFILPWPMPQNSEHLNSNVPALSAVNSMMVGSPFLSF